MQVTWRVIQPGGHSTISIRSSGMVGASRAMRPGKAEQGRQPPPPATLAAADLHALKQLGVGWVARIDTLVLQEEGEGVRGSD